MPNPDRHLINISDNKKTYLMGILHNNQQRPREGARAASSTTETAYVTNTISSATMSIMPPEAPLSDPP